MGRNEARDDKSVTPTVLETNGRPTPDAAFPLHTELICASYGKERIPMIGVECVLYRYEDLGAPASTDHGLGRDMRPVGNALVKVTEDDQHREAVAEPRVDVLSVVVAEPPTNEF